MLQPMGSQRAVHDLGTEQQQNMGNDNINYGIMGQSDEIAGWHHQLDGHGFE